MKLTNSIFKKEVFNMKVKELCEVLQYTYIVIEYDNVIYYEGICKSINEEYLECEIKNGFTSDGYEEIALVVRLKEKPQPTLEQILAKLSKEQKQEVKKILIEKFNLEM